VRKPFKPTLLARLVAELAAVSRADAGPGRLEAARAPITPVPTREVVA